MSIYSADSTENQFKHGFSRAVAPTEDVFVAALGRLGTNSDCDGARIRGIAYDLLLRRMFDRADAQRGS